MYDRILIATDGSPLSRIAAEQGVEMARSVGASVVGLHARMPVVLPYKPLISLPQKVLDSIEKPGNVASKKYLMAIQSLAQKAGVAFKGIDVVDPYPANSIIRIAKKEKCGLIVMAAHGRRGILRVLLGSETNHVLLNSHIPVLVVR